MPGQAKIVSTMMEPEIQRPELEPDHRDHQDQRVS